MKKLLETERLLLIPIDVQIIDALLESDERFHSFKALPVNVTSEIGQA
ncbi:MAG: hypothetical protein IKX74_01235 [Erysipelotrichaceae bacterium]|nr:hypothetical protein [Erysipelotrichaceae bacterium]